MLRHFSWPPGMLPSLRRWVEREATPLTSQGKDWPPPGWTRAAMTLHDSLTLLEAASAGGLIGGQKQLSLLTGPQLLRLWQYADAPGVRASAAAVTLALAVSKALRQAEQANDKRVSERLVELGEMPQWLRSRFLPVPK